MEIPFVSCSLTFTQLTRHIKIALQPRYSMQLHESSVLRLFLPLFMPFIVHCFVACCYCSRYPHTLCIASHLIGLNDVSICVRIVSGGINKIPFSTMTDCQHSRWQIQIIYECCIDCKPTYALWVNGDFSLHLELLFCQCKLSCSSLKSISLTRLTSRDIRWENLNDVVL